MKQVENTYLEEYKRVVLELSSIEREPEMYEITAAQKVQNVEIFADYFIDKFSELEPYQYLVGELCSFFQDESRMGYLGEFIVEFALKKIKEFAKNEEYVHKRIERIKKESPNIDRMKLEQLCLRAQDWKRTLSLKNMNYITMFMESLKERIDNLYTPPKVKIQQTTNRKLSIDEIIAETRKGGAKPKTTKPIRKSK